MQAQQYYQAYQAQAQWYEQQSHGAYQAQAAYEQAVQRHSAEQAVQRQAQDGSHQHKKQSRGEQPPPEPAGLPIVFFFRGFSVVSFSGHFFAGAPSKLKEKKLTNFSQLQICSPDSSRKITNKC